MANEMELIKAIDPLIKAVADIRRELAAIEARPIPEGKPGRDADPLVIAALLVEKFGEDLQGEAGKAGKDAEPVDPAQIAAQLIANKDFVELVKGEPGQAPDVEAIVKVLVRDHLDLMRGPPGKDAETLEVDIDDVCEALIKSTEFVAMAKGEKGEPGETPDVDDIVTRLFEKHGNELKGQPGIDPDLDDIAKRVKADPGFVESLKGAPGAKGDTGETGAGIEAVQWASGIYREGVTVQHYIGRYYRALRDTADEPGKSEDWMRVGTSGLRFIDEKDADLARENGDIFTDQGSTFVWLDGKSFLLARAGASGLKGTPGAKGEPGKDAPYLVAAELTPTALVLAQSDGGLVECDTSKFSANLYAIAKQACSELLEEDRKRGAGRGTPVKTFMGQLQESTSYVRGDVITHANALWTCRKSTKGRFNPDEWSRLISFPSTSPAKSNGAKSSR